LSFSSTLLILSSRLEGWWREIMNWVLIATGFTGALTLVFLLRRAHTFFFPPAATEVFFSPKGGCQDAIVRELQRARREILVQAYSFTADPITNGLIEAKKRGVHVEIVLDRSNEEDAHSDLHLLADAQVSILIDAKHAIAHNKIMVIDRKTVLTGSFNFTNQAEHENAENLLVLTHHRDLVKHYLENFQVHKSHSQAAQAHAPTAPKPFHHKAA
jgi:phosphatidylserine/phosphatidylglycerophosphate/cardiolipin synthase-like enzyme